MQHKPQLIHSDETTIAAIATPPGPGGIGIIRISGGLSLTILTKIFTPAAKQNRFTSHKLVYGWITDPGTGQPMDEVLAVYMQAPRTYTREDVVEIHCHGSYLVLQDILGLILRFGAVLADPGEFTKRAFLNGRIDLTRAEAVIELLQARTKEGLGMAMSQLQGRLYEEVTAIRNALVSLRAVIEVAIDFPEDDVEILNTADMRSQLHEDVLHPLEGLISSANQGIIYREGISVLILGRPNVGKSSLLNALLKEDRAIVTEVPGTTRDTIEEFLDIKGMPVRIVDTAGIRDNAEQVEVIGIERARRKIAEADLILMLVDGSAPPDDDDRKLYETVQGRQLLLVVNKTDISRQDISLFAEKFPDCPRVAVSAKTLEGLPELEQAIFDLVTGDDTWDPGHRVVPNIRHRAALERARDSALMVARGLEADLSPDLVAVDLQEVLDHLGDIIGVTTTEDVLDMIFDQFCIGK